MSALQPGELVDITIRGARVVEASGTHWRFNTGGRELLLAAELIGHIGILRTAPANWPPQPGDIWAETSGAEWFARAGGSGDTTVYLTSARQGFVSEDPDQILALDGPLRLVRRAGTKDLTGVGGEVPGPVATGPGTAHAVESGPAGAAIA